MATRARTTLGRRAGLLAAVWFVLPGLAAAADHPARIGFVPSALVPPPLDFFTLTPCRVVDTRLTGGPLVAGIERTIALAGTCGIPSTASAASVTVAVTQPSAAGNVRLYPAGSPLPLSSTINYVAGQTRTNNAVVGLGVAGQLAAQSRPAGSTHLIIDVNGYFEEAPSGCSDTDGDAWSSCDGDCDDGNAAVNPGAFEVPGNGIDDNCDGMVDEPASACDGGLASDSPAPLDYARAIDLCQTTVENPPLPDRRWGVISSQLLLADGTGTPGLASRSIRTSFGSGNVPWAGNAFAILSTGAAAAPSQVQPAFVAFQPGLNVGTTSGFPADWYGAHGNTLPNSPGCPAPVGSSAQDPVMLRIRVRVPTNARSFSVSVKFFSSEFPEYVCTPYNDSFVVLLDSSYGGVPANPSDKNIATYTTPSQSVYPVGVNLAYGNTGLFAECVNGSTGCAGSIPGSTTTCTGTGGLTGTGFDVPDPGHCGPDSQVGGATAGLNVKGNVAPGETIDLRFAIWDTADALFDSLVLLDNFKWSTQTVTPGAFLPD